MAQSRYCYPGTDVLINKLDIQDQETLNNFERMHTGLRALELQENPIKGDFDLKHLQQIHKYLFQDIYEFAGEIRQEDIAKDNFMFAPCRFIEGASQDIFKNLQREDFKKMDVEKFSDRLAYHVAEINILHPFREGNGRSTRIFAEHLAQASGYNLEWNRVDKEQLLEASKRSVANHKPLAEAIDQCIVNRERDRSLMRQFEDRGLER
ncbi:Fic/DOC family protein [Priestia endophytica]|uniref:protein adenylyltransferase n=1 Tax=Priestia endophytica DSM 13796 TaxID=1121089 RepID=A0A1I6C0T0_9BACI|nr:Fic family protein [Priestia endophytica]SFQ86757.1 cell filamentation protein [Priestia endophytica DSM 13796]